MKQAIRIGGKIVPMKEFDMLPEDAAPLWTPEKDEVLRNYYPTKNATALAAKFGVTRAALTRHASAIGVHKKRFKAKENPHA